MLIVAAVGVAALADGGCSDENVDPLLLSGALPEHVAMVDVALLRLVGGL